MPGSALSQGVCRVGGYREVDVPLFQRRHHQPADGCDGERGAGVGRVGVQRHDQLGHLATVTVTVTLNAGTDVIRATAATANGGPNVDYLETS